MSDIEKEIERLIKLRTNALRNARRQELKLKKNSRASVRVFPSFWFAVARDYQKEIDGLYEKIIKKEAENGTNWIKEKIKMITKLDKKALRAVTPKTFQGIYNRII